MAALDTPLERGQALAIEGEYEAALEALTEATTEDASNAKAWEATAQVLLAASDDQDERSAAKALVAAQKATEAAPHWAPAAVTRGRALLAARRWREAASALSEAVALDFEDLSLRDEARADLREAIELRDNESQGPQERTLQIKGRPLLTTSAMPLDGQCGACGTGTQGPAAGVWEASVVLAMALEWNQTNPKNVLELGSGLGVAGLAAALRGGDVVLTDLSEVVPRTLQRCATHRSLIDAAGGSAMTIAYDWRKAAPPDILEMRPYDLVLSADAIYRADLLEPFLRALDAVVGAELLIAHKRRHRELDDRLEEALNQRFDVAEAECHPLYASSSIVLWRCTRRRQQ
jgi:predicted nicotinamide N-methyase